MCWTLPAPGCGISLARATRCTGTLAHTRWRKDQRQLLALQRDQQAGLAIDNERLSSLGCQAAPGSGRGNNLEARWLTQKGLADKLPATAVSQGDVAQVALQQEGELEAKTPCHSQRIAPPPTPPPSSTQLQASAEWPRRLSWPAPRLRNGWSAMKSLPAPGCRSHHHWTGVSAAQTGRET